MPRTVDNGFDAAVVDKEDRVVALIRAKAHPVKSWAAVLPRELEKVADGVAFVLAIDPDAIRLYRPEGDGLGEPIVLLDTGRVLRYYDPEFLKKRVFDFYLLTLVEAWLRDLAYHWKSEKPPGSEELGRTGLLEMVDGGTTRRFDD